MKGAADTSPRKLEMFNERLWKLRKTPLVIPVPWHRMFFFGGGEHQIVTCATLAGKMPWREHWAGRALLRKTTRSIQVIRPPEWVFNLFLRFQPEIRTQRDANLDGRSNVRHAFSYPPAPLPPPNFPISCSARLLFVVWFARCFVHRILVVISVGCWIGCAFFYPCPYNPWNATSVRFWVRFVCSSCPSFRSARELIRIRFRSPTTFLLTVKTIYESLNVGSTGSNLV